MSYRLQFYCSVLNRSEPAKHYLTRGQAIHGARLWAHKTLAAFAKLDTQATHDVMAAIARADDILPPQEQRTIKISNTGWQVTLTNTASTRS